MIVTESVSYARIDGSWNKIEVGVDDGDYERLMSEWGVDPAVPAQSLRHQVLALQAEMFVFTRMVAARAHDDQWVANEKGAWQQQILAKAKALREKLRGA